MLHPIRIISLLKWFFSYAVDPYLHRRSERSCDVVEVAVVKELAVGAETQVQAERGDEVGRGAGAAVDSEGPLPRKDGDVIVRSTTAVTGKVVIRTEPKLTRITLD